MSLDATGHRFGLNGYTRDAYNTPLYGTITDRGGSWGWRKILRLRMFLRTMVDYRIGDGRNFFLWQDPWHHLGPLCDTFPRGPRLLVLDESSKLSTVIHEGVWQWPLIMDIERLAITHVLPTIFGGEDRIILEILEWATNSTGYL
ncbi:UNVERIFIED_CONTAM: hypothetical protein Sindi_2650800 [Sesamum indicum]